MRVSRKSWHYKVYRYFRNFYEDGPILPFRGQRTNYTPKSLCSYFWSTFLFVAIFPLVLGALAAATIGFFVTSPIWYPLVRRHERRKRQGLIKNVGDYVVVERVKSFKNKHCPLVELV